MYDLRYWMTLCEEESRVPELGTIIAYNDRRYMVKGWCKPYTPARGQRGYRFKTGGQELICCPPDEATYVFVGTTAIPLGHFTVVGHIDTTTEHGKWHIEELQRSAKRMMQFIPPDEQRDIEADRLEKQMDMTPEGFVWEWDQHGQKSEAYLPAWEWAYQRRGLIDAAEKAGYIDIGRDVRGTISLRPKGVKLLRDLKTLY